MASEFTASTGVPYAAVKRCQMIRQLRNTHTIGGCTDLFTAVQGNPPISSSISVGINSRPNYYLAETATEVCVFLDGIVNADQGLAIWEGYTGGPFNNIADIPNPWFTAAALSIYNSIQTKLGQNVNVYMAGWSAGGATAWHLAKLLRDNNKALHIGITAFGSPMSFATGSHALKVTDAGTTDTIHYMNSDDPVPFIPPSPGVWARISAGLTIFQAERLAGWQGYPNGVNIRQTLVLQAGSLPLDNTAPALSAIGTWLNQQSAGITNPHSLEVYYARLLATIPSPAALPQIVPVHNAQPPIVPVTPQQIRQIDRANVQTAFEDSTRQNANQAIIPEDRLFQAFRVGKIWSVWFGGVQIAIAPRKRRARALANLGNAFLRKLQNEAVVNADDLVSQFLLYMSQATDPNSGFVPTMNTEL